jgi:hypothetical protein
MSCTHTLSDAPTKTRMRHFSKCSVGTATATHADRKPTGKSYGSRTFRTLELVLYRSPGKLPEPESTHEFSERASLQQCDPSSLRRSEIATVRFGAAEAVRS